MPIYEYACHSCAHRFETIQKAVEEPLRDCPECGKPALKKLLSAPVFRLKGSGWYETDFKTGDKRNVVESGDAKGDDSSASNGGGGGGGDGEASKKAADTTAKGDATKPAASGEGGSSAKTESGSDAKKPGTAGKADARSGKPNPKDS